MELIRFIWILLQVGIGYNLVLPGFIYLLSFFKNNQPKALQTSAADYAIIVTAYEQVTHIPAVVSSLLQLNYEQYLIYIVADKCDISQLKFNDDRVIILRPEATLASNTRSHFYAINNFKRPHNRLTIIDSDNLVHPEYLNELDCYFNQGYIAVQGIRKAKNLDTTYACLDAARDIYYHFYDGKLLFNVGSSATLAGSGMAFTTALYRDCLENRDVTGAGFDKVLQYLIVKQNHRIAFNEQAVVYDQKTSETDQLVNQRARWINTWFKYFGYGFKLLFTGIRNFSLNQFLFGLILLRPPLFLFLAFSVICALTDLEIHSVYSWFWLIGCIIFVWSFLIALWRSDTDKRIYSSLAGIPKFMFFQFVSLARSHKANKHSVATKHAILIKPEGMDADKNNLKTY
ncbi:MAG: putative capsule-related protein [Mucilaginibacter sp.]|nr:putative capsule-related protein [Mucilaginibacter sp.]